MTRKTSGCRLILVSVLVFTCLGAALLAAAGIYLPIQAQRQFGPASPNLDLIDKYYLSARLLLQAGDLNTSAVQEPVLVPFQIALNEPTAQVIERLNALGLVKNTQAFSDYLQYSGLDTTLQAGEYTLSPALSPVEIAHALQDPTPASIQFGVLAGWRIEEVAASIATSGLSIDPQAFLQSAMSRPQGYSFSTDLPPQATAEGFLFPGSYSVPRDAGTNELLALILTGFDTQVSSELRQAIANQGLTLYEGVTLASLIEREAILDEEMPLIASVFYNRLAAGIKLDSDPTVQYALGFNSAQNTWWTNPLTSTDIPSAYNTYLNPGLPPGPIASPGLAALQAVASPASTPYYYFRAACDGSGRHTFAVDYQEHLQNTCP